MSDRESKFRTVLYKEFSLIDIQVIPHKKRDIQVMAEASEVQAAGRFARTVSVSLTPVSSWSTARGTMPHTSPPHGIHLSKTELCQEAQPNGCQDGEVLAQKHGMLLYFWAEAVKTLVYILNRGREYRGRENSRPSTVVVVLVRRSSRALAQRFPDSLLQ